MGSATLWLRNALVLALMACAFPLCLMAANQAFQWVGVKDAGLFALLLASIPYGIVGAILFGGTPLQRGALVMSAVAITAVVREVLTADQRHPGLMLAFTLPLALIPTAVTLVYASVRAPAKRPEDGPSRESGPTP